MNWSKPRSVPCTVRFPLSLTAGTQRGNTTVRIGAEEEIKPTLNVDHKERATWWRAVRVLSSFLSMYLRGAMASSSTANRERPHQSRLTHARSLWCAACAWRKGACVAVADAHFLRSGPAAEGMLSSQRYSERSSTGARACERAKGLAQDASLPTNIGFWWSCDTHARRAVRCSVPARLLCTHARALARTGAMGAAPGHRMRLELIYGACSAASSTGDAGSNGALR